MSNHLLHLAFHAPSTKPYYTDKAIRDPSRHSFHDTLPSWYEMTWEEASEHLVESQRKAWITLRSVKKRLLKTKLIGMSKQRRDAMALKVLVSPYFTK